MQEIFAIIIAIGVIVGIAYYGYGLLCDIFDI